VIKRIKHAINVMKHSLRDVSVSVKRSPQWRTVEKHFLEAHPICAACGSKNKLNVHHCMPFHLDKSLELDPNNLITLCMGKLECHLTIGHGGSFRQYCPDVRKYAAKVLADRSQFDDIVKLARANIKEN